MDTVLQAAAKGKPYSLRNPSSGTTYAWSMTAGWWEAEAQTMVAELWGRRQHCGRHCVGTLGVLSELGNQQKKESLQALEQAGLGYAYVQGVFKCGRRLWDKWAGCEKMGRKRKEADTRCTRPSTLLPRIHQLPTSKLRKRDSKKSQASVVTCGQKKRSSETRD
eukprot:TRINITY_DN3418_c0_g2_i2.p1 TRINITY_DN3418_c0_g2~~TRINITY_DN3418_c0_g2_i2.p1  ORF type:complete len:164 (+),score=5.83 TRINITY_DN3418_c0_g2_i2:319-810(+)